MNNEWLPIETAPKDGSKIIGYLADENNRYPNHYVVQWIKGKKAWVIAGSWHMKPTHWKPLPKPPQNEPTP